MCSKVQSWIDDGFVKLSDTKPFHVNPKWVAVKLDLLSYKIKKRPVMDMSGCINKKLAKKPFNHGQFNCIRKFFNKERRFSRNILSGKYVFSF